MTRLAVALVLLVSASSAAAQDGDAPVPSRAAAAEAYDRGSAFYLAGDYARAAQWFETAYRLAPAAPTLVQAIRAQLRAGDALRAANLALRLRGLHGDDADAAAFAAEVLAEHEPSFLRLDVACAECTLEIDGRVWSFPSAMLEPGADHRVVVQRGDVRRELTLRGERGERRVLEPPEPEAAEAAEPAAPEEPVDPTPAHEPAPSAGRMPLPPWVFGIGVGLTVASAAVLIWSGVDTLEGVDDFERMPTWEAFLEGEAKEVRTNVLVGITVGVGALTVLAAIFTDWGGAPAVALAVDASTAVLTVSDAF